MEIEEILLRAAIFVPTEHGHFPDTPRSSTMPRTSKS